MYKSNKNMFRSVLFCSVHKLGLAKRWRVCLAPDKVLFFCPKQRYFFLLLHDNIRCGYSLKRLNEALLMSTFDVCCRRELRKIIILTLLAYIANG